MNKELIMNKADISTLHGQIANPESRAAKTHQWWANALESGKFFPEIQSGLSDKYAPTDIPNQKPPEDGKIASAGLAGAEKLDEYGENRWEKNEIKSGAIIDFTWTYTAVHRTRRWNYFITKDNWKPNEPLSRAQFEKEPFFMVQNDKQPYWEHDLMPNNPTIHKVKMPNKKGYHIILGVWEIADTGNAFYQVVDVNFV
ncbi:GlcNAc-binding protein A precursor [Sodalis glossinidius str. 'morsitans']|uniref:GlcNAc-binding protein A n=2 Tax=Sodalis glossinidius TaxID=63612 RepID=A0A193QKF1_SODGM|nr:lytic polysaccharide monooxygenase auxiliary activity family 9 protein [Sodalis glossinidius]CRL45656.1 GlcNAc-binding protein A precursor [Sodalis glossinidius str. 'morsitans']